LYEELEPMLRANLYEFGKDADGDSSIALFPALDTFMGTKSPDGIAAAFETLLSILGPDRQPSTPEDEIKTED
jgi:flagellum-specific ATP synthase